jgi:hypothetical protein
MSPNMLGPFEVRKYCFLFHQNNDFSHKLNLLSFMVLVF